MLLVDGVAVPGWGGQNNIDDAYVTVSIPFAISMYGVSTTTPSVQSNGVSNLIEVLSHTEKLIHLFDSIS